MTKTREIEGIPAPFAKVYAIISKKNRIILDQRVEAAEEIASDMAYGSVLDVGTGPGYLPVEIVKRNKNLKIIGIDISPAMVEIAKKVALKEKLNESLEFQEANAVNLPFDSNSFDKVVSTASIHHWSKPAECLKEMIRVLKPGRTTWIYDLFSDEITKEDKLKFKEKYGRLKSFHFTRFIRKYNSVSMEDVRKIMAAPGMNEYKYEIENRGVYFKLTIEKNM